MPTIPTDGRGRVTEKTIAQIPLQTSGQPVFWHPEIAGFGVRVGAKSRTYMVQAKVTISGRKRDRKTSIGNTAHWTLEDATAEAKRLLREMDQDIDPKFEAQKRARSVTTLRQLVVRVRQSKGPDYATNLEAYFNGECDMMDAPIEHITGDAVERRYREIQEEVQARNPQRNGVSTANAAMRSLSAVWNLADALGVLNSVGEPLPKNPVPALSKRKLLKPTAKREDRFTPDDLAKFWKAVWDVPFYSGRDAVIFMLLTGLRRGVATNLRREEWDSETATIKLPAHRNKSKRPLTLPVAKEIAAMLDRRVNDPKVLQSKGGRAGYVFPGGNGAEFVKEPRYVVDNICKAIGSDHVSVHGLRRTYGSEALFVMGEVQRKMLMDHSLASGGVTQAHYSVISAEDLRASAQAVADRIIGYADNDGGPKGGAAEVRTRMADGRGTVHPSEVYAAARLDAAIEKAADNSMKISWEELTALIEKHGEPEFRRFGKVAKPSE